MKPSLKSWSFHFTPWGTAALIFTGFAAYFGHSWLAAAAAIVGGAGFRTETEYHIEKNNYARTLAAMVANVGPRDGRFREDALLAVSRLEQVARKSQQLPNEDLDRLRAEIVKFRLTLEATITKEGL